METFTAASHHDILVLLVQIAVLLATARLLGELAQRFGQPSVVGEILAGIVLGPSLLSGIFPLIDKWMIPHEPVQGYLLELVGLMGVMFLLLITGLETDLLLIRAQARSAIGVALGGLVVPLLLGFLLGQAIPDNYLQDGSRRSVFSLYLATAMAISAIPVIAKVLMDFNLTRRDAGQTIIAAAMIDDTMGWILLSVVIGIASGSAVDIATVAESIGSVVGFMIVSFTVGVWMVRRLLTFVQHHINSREKTLSMVIFLTFGWGAVSQALQLEALIGAFAMGIILSQLRDLDTDVVHKLESIALGIFAPIFFAIAGLKVNIISLFEPELIAITLLVVTVAVVCKVVGIYVGARLIGGSDHWTALFYGAGLNARGSMGIIIASIGLQLNIITQDLFSIIVVMAVTTSLMAPLGLRWTLKHMKTDEQELERLRREAMDKENIVAQIRRVLLPMRPRKDSTMTHFLEATFLSRLASNASVTLLTVAQKGDTLVGQDFLVHVETLFTEQKTTRKVAQADNPAETILDEARRGYDLLVLGASERQADSRIIFSPVIDSLVRLAPCPVMVVHGQGITPDWFPRHILVPTTGSVAGRHAAQMAFALVSGTEGEVTMLNVVRKNSPSSDMYVQDTLESRQLQVGQGFISQLIEMGKMGGINANGKVLVGAEPEKTILQVAEQEGIDLIVLGTSVRPSSDHLYLGPKVDYILNHAQCPVIILNST